MPPHQDLERRRVARLHVTAQQLDIRVMAGPVIGQPSQPGYKPVQPGHMIRSSLSVFVLYRVGDRPFASKIAAGSASISALIQ